MRVGGRIRSLLRALALGLLVSASATRARAQLPEIDIRTFSGALSPTVAVRNVLTERPFGEPMRNGFPTRIHVRAEVWTIGRYFDEIVGREEWEIIVRYDITDRVYEVARFTVDAPTQLGTYTRLADARAASELAFAMAFSPASLANARGKKGYVAAQVDVQTVEMSDLDEVQRWLRGEAQPVVRGRRSPGTALTRGIRALFSRLLGGEVRHYEGRTGVLQF